MDPAIIGAGLNLLGGLFGKKEKSAYRNTRDAMIGQAETARVAGERYGFNPLTLLGVSSPLGPSGGSDYMGQAIADSALMLADSLAKKSDTGKVSVLEQANKKLQDEVRDLTLRPKVGGVYAQRERTPTVREALGVSPAPVYAGPNGGEDAGTSEVHPLDASLGNVDVPPDRLDRASPAFVGGSLLEAAPGWSSPAYMEDKVWGENPVLSWPYSLAWAGASATHNVNKALGLPHIKSKRGEIDFFLEDQKARDYSAKPAKSPKSKFRATLRFDPNHRDAYYFAF